MNLHTLRSAVLSAGSIAELEPVMADLKSWGTPAAADLHRKAVRRMAALKAVASRKQGRPAPVVVAAPAPAPALPQDPEAAARALLALVGQSETALATVRDALGGLWFSETAEAAEARARAEVEQAHRAQRAAAQKSARIPARKLGLPSREENKAVRGADFRASVEAHKAADLEVGRDSMGDPLWASVPGCAHRVRVPADVALYIPLKGRAQRGERERLVPAPRFWPGGAFPEGYEDLGQHVPRIPRQPQPGSLAWRQALEARAACAGNLKSLAAERQRRAQTRAA